MTAAEGAAGAREASAEIAADRAPTRREWIALAVLSIGLGLIVLDGTIVGVALPAIISDLRLDLTDAQWVNSLYAVVLAALLLSTGSLADRWGRKRLFLAGLVVFMGGSLLAAISASAGALIGARAVQAVGAALIMPSTLSTVNAIFRPTPEAVEYARRVVEAHEAAVERGEGITVIEGRVVDRPAASRARRLIELATAIESREAQSAI